MAGDTLTFIGIIIFWFNINWKSHFEADYSQFEVDYFQFENDHSQLEVEYSHFEIEEV